MIREGTQLYLLDNGFYFIIIERSSAAEGAEA